MRSAKIKLEFDPKLSQPRAWSNPVVPGDHPDPTIVLVGQTYWASCTSGEWSPQFPLFCSNDLVQWEPAGCIFPEQPGWAEGSFWAPELVHDEVTGRFLVWYVGRQRGGTLAVAVATADRPGGPYTDHGPLIAQPNGSIDPCFARDEHGEPFLIWKEDGNSQGRPTPIWAQRLTDDLLQLTGEKTQLITSDQPWEEGIVEGPYILRRFEAGGHNRFYMFYAGNTCCGRSCKYAEGIARADNLLGPWTKFPANPVIAANENWRCPGHGAAVHSAGTGDKPAHDYFLYHAYPTGGTVYIGREAVLDEITWAPPDPDGKPSWPIINSGHGVGQPAPAPAIDFSDDFDAATLDPSWQWPVNTHPEVVAGDGALKLCIPLDSPLSPQPVESALVAVPRPASLHFRATVGVDVPQIPEPTLWSGLTIVGDPFNTVGLGLRGSQSGPGHDVILWERRGAHQQVVCQSPAPEGTCLFLRAASTDPDGGVQFSYSVDGLNFTPLDRPYDTSELPAWDRGLRLALMLEGPRGRWATFRKFALLADASPLD